MKNMRISNIIENTVLGPWLFHVFKEFYTNKCNMCFNYVNILSKLINIYEFIEYARLNKILVALAELCNTYNCTNTLLQQRKYRYAIYQSEIKHIAKAFEDNGINYVIIKTILPFPKDIADIDILVDQEEDLKRARYVLSNLGYKRRKEGLEQDLWSTVRNNIIVDVELHTSVAAAEYEYIPKKLLINNAIKINGVRLPSLLDELVLTAAHSVLKDIYITLADILSFYLSLKGNKINSHDVVKYAENIGLTTPIRLYLSLLEWLNQVSLRTNLNFIIQVNPNSTPLRPHIHIVAYSYFENTLYKLKNNGILRTLRELTSLPQGKGIDTLIRYLAGAKPPVKKLDE